jgi:hypothetical protein
MRFLIRVALDNEAEYSRATQTTYSNEWFKELLQSMSDTSLRGKVHVCIGKSRIRQSGELSSVGDSVAFVGFGMQSACSRAAACSRATVASATIQRLQSPSVLSRK